MVEGTKRGAARPRPASEVPAPARPLVLLRLAIRPGRAVERQSRTVTFEEPGPAVWRGQLAVDGPVDRGSADELGRLGRRFAELPGAGR